MEIDDVLPPLPLDPPGFFDLDEGIAPPPPPLQNFQGAMAQQPPRKGSITSVATSQRRAIPNPQCPRTARHAPPVSGFLPDLKLLRDVKIRVSFTESSNINSKDRKVLYTGEGRRQEVMMVRQHECAAGSADEETVTFAYEEEFDNDVDALLEEGMPVPKKMRPSEEKYGGESDHPSDGEGGVQPMMTKIKTVLKSRGRPPTEPLPDGWIMTFHNSGIPVYLHRETRVVTWSRPYFLGTGSIRKHDPPTSSIPCLHYKKIKALEEKELNGEGTQNAEETPVKPVDETNGEEMAGPSEAPAQGQYLIPPFIVFDGVHGGGSTPKISLACKRPHAFDTAQGALGQVRAKVEVCKDESIVTVKKFRTWAERRQFNRDLKRKQAECERPILPANQKLITLSVQDAPTKKEFVINPNGKSERVTYGTGTASSKKLAKNKAARATLEILIPDFVKQTSEEKPVEGDELEYFNHISIEDTRVYELTNKQDYFRHIRFFTSALKETMGWETPALSLR
ncbi:hypothetical protein KUCAC02_028099 [Chaenocephalus aceratus]|uniref:Uncharacterized protein n=1 Tax=Chaenocephalus aceratus TaxID=36190 RepID=A0ACB9X108_CHAAC|nr:hypothetical protein KUCAC02_028099 [Chaenocephalus aceratus]